MVIRNGPEAPTTAVVGGSTGPFIVAATTLIQHSPSLEPVCLLMYAAALAAAAIRTRGGGCHVPSDGDIAGRM